MASEHFSLRLPKETKIKLQELANATGRTKAFLAIDAIEQYLKTEAWQINAIQEGINAVDNNETISIEEIKNDWNLE